MVLGICGICLVCLYGLGAILGVIAIIFGLIARSSINRNPQAYTGKGFAIAGIATGAGSLLIMAAMIALVAALLFPAFKGSRELSNRSVCAANLRGIMQSMAVYANDNNDQYPIIFGKAGYGLANASPGTPDPNADKVINSLFTTNPAPSVTQNIWLLVLNGQVAPKQFLCKSDPAPAVSATTTIAGNYQTNFNDNGKPSDFTYSYSFAYPWTTTTGVIGDWWKYTTDAGLPLIADMSPMGGAGANATTTVNPAARTANSFNHQRDGQNIGFGDGHAEFARRPDAGQNADNIYTFNKGIPSPTGTAFTGNAAPDIGIGGAPGNYDICLVPVADANANYTRK